MTEQGNRILRMVGDRPDEPADLLDDIETFIRRFCVFPDEHCLTAVTLWAAHAHVVENFHTTPRLALLSPEPGSGKTRVLEVLDLLTPESMFVFNASPAAIFRSLADVQKTLLFDEVDAIFSKKGRDENHEDLRALLNAGYKSGQTIPRCTGGNHEVTYFNAFCAVALASLGQLPDTIMSRSVIVKMRRRAPSEHVEPFRSRMHSSLGHSLRDRLNVWGNEIGHQVGDAWPKLPDGIEDRNAEIWEPLIAVADAAGGSWPEKARAACLALVKAAEDHQLSLGLRLLSDLRIVFTKSCERKLSTEYILESLKSSHSGLDDDAPWADLYGDGLNARKMAQFLKPYGISSRKIRIDEITRQGYTVEDLFDAWLRYLPSFDHAQTEQAEQTEQGLSNRGLVPGVLDVPDKQSAECVKCAGEGCAWCAAPAAVLPMTH